MSLSKKKKYLIAFVVILLAFSYWTWRLFSIPTSAMNPTIPTGSKIISQRYLFSKPQRGDVVIFTTENIKYRDQGLIGTQYIKRLIGLPGDEVLIQEGKLIINGELFESDIYYTLPLPHETEHINFEKPLIVIPEDHYFVLGDNSQMSLDGRYFGPIPAENIWARMIYLFE